MVVEQPNIIVTCDCDENLWLCICIRYMSCLHIEPEDESIFNLVLVMLLLCNPKRCVLHLKKVFTVRKWTITHIIPQRGIKGHTHTYSHNTHIQTSIKSCLHHTHKSLSSWKNCIVFLACYIVHMVLKASLFSPAFCHKNCPLSCPLHAPFWFYFVSFPCQSDLWKLIVCIERGVLSLQEYSVQVTFREQWNDERLRYHDDTQGNNVLGLQWCELICVFKGRLKYLTLTDPTKVWMPDTFFRNEKEARKHEIIVPNVYVRIFPDGEILYSIR